MEKQRRPRATERITDQSADGSILLVSKQMASTAGRALCLFAVILVLSVAFQKTEALCDGCPCKSNSDCDDTLECKNNNCYTPCHSVCPADGPCHVKNHKVQSCAYDYVPKN